MSEVLEVTKRESHGKLNNQRLRRRGRVPAVVYGHGTTPLSVSVSAEGLEATMRHGAKVVDLSGDTTGQALLQEVQWDTFQHHVLHVDLLRVDAQDRVTIEVDILLRGEAPGEREGGVVEHLVHRVEVETDPAHIPDHLHVNINHLHLGGVLKVSDIFDVPPGAKVLEPADTVLVQCVEPGAEPEEEALAEGAEPEVIGRKAAEEESDE